jgi:hypothetical protein
VKLFTPGSLLLGLLLSAPSLMSAWSDPGADVAGALGRFLLAVVVAGAGLSFLRGMIASYQGSAARDAEGATTITTLPASAPTVVASDEVLPA